MTWGELVLLILAVVWVIFTYTIPYHQCVIEYSNKHLKTPQQVWEESVTVRLLCLAMHLQAFTVPGFVCSFYFLQKTWFVNAPKDVFTTSLLLGTTMVLLFVMGGSFLLWSQTKQSLGVIGWSPAHINFRFSHRRRSP